MRRGALASSPMALLASRRLLDDLVAPDAWQAPPEESTEVDASQVQIEVAGQRIDPEHFIDVDDPTDAAP